MDGFHQVAAAGAAVRGALLGAARDGCAAATADLAARRAALSARPTELHDFMEFQVSIPAIEEILNSDARGFQHIMNVCMRRSMSPVIFKFPPK